MINGSLGRAPTCYGRARRQIAAHALLSLRYQLCRVLMCPLHHLAMEAPAHPVRTRQVHRRHDSVRETFTPQNSLWYRISKNQHLNLKHHFGRMSAGHSSSFAGTTQHRYLIFSFRGLKRRQRTTFARESTSLPSPATSRHAGHLRPFRDASLARHS